MKYRADIDGLRALAIVPVVLFHAGISGFSGGSVGVDIFFVISGFLITSILLEEQARGEFSLTKFYERRIRRIAPALFLMMFACIPFAWMWMLPEQMASFSDSLSGAALSVSNMVFWSESGYFAAAAEEKPLLHTWSLAVEEQFYLLFPLLLGWLWKKGQASLVKWLVVIAALSLLLSEWGWRHEPTANFFFALSRAWELLAGALAACCVRAGWARVHNGLSLLGLLLLLVAIFRFDDQLPFPSVYALVPVLGAVLVIMFGGSETLVGRLLGQKPLVFVGLISYSTYLWHQPLFAYSRIRTTEDPGMMEMTALTVASFVLGYLGYRFVEQPFRSRERFSSKFMFRFFFAGTALFIAVGAAGNLTKGWPQRFEQPAFVEQGKFALPSRSQGFCFYDFNTDKTLKPGSDGVECSMSAEGVESLHSLERSQGSDEKKARSVLLFGDSFAAQWEPYFKKMAAKQPLQLHSVTTNWCFPSLGDGSTAKVSHRSRSQCDMNRAWFANHYQDYDVIVLAGAWYQVQQHQLSEEVEDLIRHVAQNPDVQVVVLDVPPLFRRDSVERAVYFTDQNVLVDPLKADPAQAFWQQLVSNVADVPRVRLIDQRDLGLTSERGYKTEEGYPYSLDGSHLSVYGSERLYAENPVLAKQILDLL